MNQRAAGPIARALWRMSSASVAFGWRSSSSRTSCTPRKPVAPVTKMSSSLFISKPTLVREHKGRRIMTAGCLYDGLRYRSL